MRFYLIKSGFGPKIRDWWRYWLERWKSWLEKRREESTRKIVKRINEIVSIARQEGLYPSLSKVEKDEVTFAVQVIGIKRGNFQIKRNIVWVIVAISAVIFKILAN